MTQSKEWEWEKVMDPVWLEPCEVSYYYARRWKAAGKKSILDLGSGLGRHAMLFARNGFKVTAVDLSEYAINHLRTWQKKEKVDILSKVSDMNELPFQDNAFDCIWAYHVISHTDTKGFLIVLNEIKRVLKPNGEIFFTLCSKDSSVFKDGNFPQVDENTILKTEGEAEIEVPHYFVDLEDVLRLFGDFDIEFINHINYCYMDGRIIDSKHYYVMAKLNKSETVFDYSGIIGQTVKGSIDRPVGSTHPKYSNIKYPLNYGYVNGIMASDDSEQDVYLFGESKPVKTFEGVVIAVIHRYNDLENKWVVSSDGTDYTDKEILEMVNFQERYFDIKLIR